jgi:hypothetical protein
MKWKITHGHKIVNPDAEKHLRTLEAAFDYSINNLDENLKHLLPKLTLFQSPFPSSAASEIFGVNKVDVINLYIRSLLTTRIESDEYGKLPEQDYWLYSFHPVIRKYLEDKAKRNEHNLEKDTIFCYYFDDTPLNLACISWFSAFNNTVDFLDLYHLHMLFD